MIKVYKWFLTLYPNTVFYINKQMYEETKNESFDMAEIYVRGQINDPKSDTPVHILFKVNYIKDDIAVSKNKKEYKLVNKLENYIQFEEAIQHKMTIIYDWFIGIDKSNELRIEGMAYEDGFTFPINEVIKAQDIKNSTITLNTGETVFVMWGSLNNKFKKHIQKILNVSSELLIEGPIDLENNKCYMPDLLKLQNEILKSEYKNPKTAYQKTYKKS